ncbi:MAG: hypothetical protein JWQ19_1903 [Subtercola sp.]|nr:hypothetical protein [Subtercola sp.]
MSSRAARTLRGLTAAGVAVFVAALSHALGGGDAPGGIGVVLALAFSAVVCVALAGRTLSLVRLSLAVGFSQLAFHLLFSVGGGGASTAAGAGAGAGSGAADALQRMSAMSGMSGMGAAGMSHGTSLLSLPADTALAHAVAGATASTAVDPWALVATLFCGWMWVAHVAAAAVTVAALHRGAAAAAAALESARVHVRRLVQLPFVEPVGVRRVDVAFARRRAPDHPRALEVLIGRLRHRGPPVWQFAQP